MPNPKWLEWAKQLQVIAQDGLTYAESSYDVTRYEAIRTIASEMMAANSKAVSQAVTDLFKGELGHATPKVDVRGAVFRNDEVLLSKERDDRLWSLPGGWADASESPSEAVIRELREETGYRVKVAKLVAVYDRDHKRHGHTPYPFYVYKLFFLCELAGGTPIEEGVETEEVGFFRVDQLPPLSLLRVTPSQIARLYEHYRQPDLPTDFD